MITLSTIQDIKVMQEWWTWLFCRVWPAVLLIHYAPFDLSFLPPSFTRYSLVYDISALIRALYPLDLPLQKLLTEFDISAQGPAHQALGDVLTRDHYINYIVSS